MFVAYLCLLVTGMVQVFSVRVLVSLPSLLHLCNCTKSFEIWRNRVLWSNLIKSAHTLFLIVFCTIPD
jgi:hypothetical protein